MCRVRHKARQVLQQEWSEAAESNMEIKKSTLMWIVIGLLFVAVLFFTFKTSSLTGNATGSGKLDMSGWTENEKMNYEMHDTIPARFQGKVSASSASAGSGMVGGC